MTDFEHECIERRICPRCLNMGYDSELDLLGSCSRCGWNLHWTRNDGRTAADDRADDPRRGQAEWINKMNRSSY